MDTVKNDISPKAMLSAVAGLMFFAPFIKNSVNSDQHFTEEEKKFIMWYVKVGFVNLTFLIIILVTALLNIFWVQPYLSWVINIWSIAVYIITIFSIVTCANSLSMRGEDEKIVYNIQHKWQILKSYTPILNFYLWFHQQNYNMPYRWLKESILLWTCFIFGTILLGSSFGMWILIIMFVRVLLLLLNIDIIPLSMKKAINNIFSCNPWEMFAYFFAPLISKVRKIDYGTVLQEKKLWYQQWQKFWISIILQYLMFGGILYLLHCNITFSISEIILYVAALLWIVRIIIFSICKKTALRIPILSEIVSLVFH